MRIVTIPKFDGWFGALIFHAGLVLFFCSVYLMWYNNISTESFIQLMYGGSVLIKNNDWGIPVPVVVSGGELPIGFGMVIGVVFSVVQIIFWLTNDSILKDQSANVKAVAKFALGADAFTAFFALMGGTNMFDVLWDDWSYFAVKVVLSAIISIGFLSIGSEIFLSLAIESMRTNKDEGFKVWKGLFSSIFRAIDSLFDKVSKGSNAPNRQNQVKPVQSFSAPQNQPSRREQLDRDLRAAMGGKPNYQQRQDFGKPQEREPKSIDAFMRDKLGDRE